MSKFLGYSSRLIFVYLSLLALVMVLEFQYTLDLESPASILAKGNRNRRRILKSGDSVRGGSGVRVGSDTNDFTSDATVGPEAASVNDSGISSEFIVYDPRDGDFYPHGTDASNVGSVRISPSVGPPASEGPPPGKEELKKIKVSPEKNAFDELIDLMTAPKTHCLVLNTKGRPTKPAYRCSVPKYRDCRSRFSKDKFQNQRRKCQSGVKGRHKYKAGYEVNPMAPVWDGETDPRANSIQETWGEGEKGVTKYTITVDAAYTFLEEFGRLKYSPLITFDTKFDLAGLNSVHKYEVVWKLLQIFRWLLTRQGYQLVRSSTDGEDLQEYLHEEGLQEPLHILTQWKSPA